MVFTANLSSIFAETKISYSDSMYLNKEVNTGHYLSSLVLGGTMNLYAGNTFSGITLTTVKMLSYGMIVYGIMNFYSSQSISIDNTWNYTHGENYVTGQTISAPSINYISLAILAGGILISGLTSALDICTGLDTIETRKKNILRDYNIDLNISPVSNQTQINVGIKF